MPRCKIIAEIGSVHDGSFGNALKLIELAAACGVDVVKFQTHISEAETLRDAPNPPYFKGEDRFTYFERTGFDAGQWRALKAKAEECNVGFISSPFSIEAVDFLDDLGIDAYKIPSGEVTNIPMLERIAQTGKEVWLSSGMSNWAELDMAVSALGKDHLTILQCSSQYPCTPENVGINVLYEMTERYGVPVGFSDHTTGFAAALLALHAGATLIEKHITFSKAMYGSDAVHSMEPEDLKLFCAMIREAEAILSHDVDKDDISAYADMKGIFEKSIVTACDVETGQEITRDVLAYKKPGSGLKAANYKDLLGKRFSQSLPKDTILSKGDIING